MSMAQQDGEAFARYPQEAEPHSIVTEQYIGQSVLHAVDSEEELDEKSGQPAPEMDEPSDEELQKIEKELDLSTGEGELDLLQVYFRSIAGKLLTDTEVYLLSKREKTGDLAARNKLVEANLRWAYTLAKKKQGQGLSLLDLIQEATLGLMHAVKKFDPDRGFKISTYSTAWINQFMERAIASQGQNMPIPVNEVVLLKRIIKKENEYFALHGVLPTSEKLSELARVPQDKVELLKTAGKFTLSLDFTKSSDEDNSEPSTFITDINAETTEEEAIDFVEKAEAKQEVAKRLAAIDPQLASVIALHYGVGAKEPLKKAEIAKILRISISMVSTRLQRAYIALQEQDEAEL